MIRVNSTQLKGPGALVVAFLAMLVTAHAQLFVTSENGFANSAGLGEYNSSTGSAINASLIPPGGLYLPLGMTISGQNLFIANGGGNNDVGEYNTSGGTVNSTLITGQSGPSGIATDGTYLYIVNNGNGKITKYTTGGGLVNSSLVSGLTSAGALAISGNNLFVGYTNGAVGEWTTSGSLVSQFFLTGFSGGVSALAVAGNNLFVASGNGTIGEYTTSGTTLNASLVTGLTEGAYGMAATSSQLFVAQYGNAQLNAGSGSVYEYGLGTPGTVTSTDTSFITGLYEPHDIVIAPVPEPSTWALMAGGLVALVSRCRRASRR